MAAAIIEALRLQVTRNTVARARLSLARQARLLLDAGIDAGKLENFNHDNFEHVDIAQLARAQGKRELTHWGPGWRCPLPYSLDGIELGWTRPARPLRSDAARWARHKQDAA